MDQAAFDFDLKLTTDEAAVYSLLGNGRTRAVTARTLSERTGLNDVQVRQTIRDLIMEHGILVASAVDDPPGFFIARTPDEIISATKSLRHRGIMILVRAARLQKSSLEMVFNQGRLELGRKENHEG